MLHDTADEHTTLDCTTWDMWETYTPEIKANLMSFAMSNMDALQVCDVRLWNRIISLIACERI
jgi:hypothetical protein